MVSLNIASPGLVFFTNLEFFSPSSIPLLHSFSKSLKEALSVNGNFNKMIIEISRKIHYNGKIFIQFKTMTSFNMYVPMMHQFQAS